MFEMLLPDRVLEFDSGERAQLHELAAWRDQFDGVVFIIASGPSVLQFPMRRYCNYPMMAMNGSIRRFIDEGVRPLFYLCDDRGAAAREGVGVARGVAFSKNSALSYEVMQEIAKHTPEALLQGTLHLMERVNRPLGGATVSDRRFAWSVRKNPEYLVEWSLFHQRRNRIGFSRNFANGYFNGRTIPYAAIQLAYYLGFTKVFLVGVDMTPEKGQFYDRLGEIAKSRLADDYADYILPSFQLMAKRVVGSDFQVFNMSAESRIPSCVVPKINYEQLDYILTKES